MPSQSDVTGNLLIGYEKDRLSLRLTANYKSDYLYEVGNVSDKRYDSRVDDQTQIDFSARYSLTDNLQVFFNAETSATSPTTSTAATVATTTSTKSTARPTPSA